MQTSSSLHNHHTVIDRPMAAFPLGMQNSSSGHHLHVSQVRYTLYTAHLMSWLYPLRIDCTQPVCRNHWPAGTLCRRRSEKVVCN